MTVKLELSGELKSMRDENKLIMSTGVRSSRGTIVRKSQENGTTLVQKV